MINLEKLQSVLTGYKDYFPKHWEDEKYKWEAVLHFQKHWDMDAKISARCLSRLQVRPLTFWLPATLIPEL